VKIVRLTAKKECQTFIICSEGGVRDERKKSKKKVDRILRGTSPRKKSARGTRPRRHT